MLTGPNGVGKTNVLEAASMGCIGSSPRTSQELSCIRDGEAACTIDVWLNTPRASQHRRMQIVSGRGKLLIVDESPVSGIAAFAAQAPCATFLPERLLIMRGAPARRRQLLDAATATLIPAATHASRTYSAALVQRNTLLRRAKAGADVRQQVEPWTQQLVEAGLELRAARAEAVALLLPRIAHRFDELTGLPGARVAVDLRGGADLATALQDSWLTDSRRGATTTGPHLDDVRLEVDGRDLRDRGSTGEQRSALLAWTLALHDAIAADRGETFPLLLDEPWAELDARRQQRLTSVLEAAPQVITTATEPPDSCLQVASSIFAVTSGKVAPWTKTP